MSFIDAAVAGVLPKNVAGAANVVLTTNDGAADESRYGCFPFTGALTGNIFVLFPAAKTFKFIVKNNTTGAFTLSLGVNNGSGAPVGATITVPQGSAGLFYSDGTDINAGSPQTGVGGDLAGLLPNPTVVATHLSAPLPVAQGGTGAAAGAAALANLGYVPPVIHTQTITVSGNFTIPVGATTATVFRFTAVGGGGGGSGSGGGTNPGTSGSSGGAGQAAFSGFTPSTNIAIVIGAAGVAGGGAGAGGAGGDTTLTYSAATIVTASGASAPASYQAQAGAVGAFAAPGGGGLSLVSSNLFGAQPGNSGWNGSFVGMAGGGNGIGSGGRGGLRSGTTPTAGTFGAGGGSAADTAGAVGAAGGAGIVIVEWVL